VEARAIGRKRLRSLDRRTPTAYHLLALGTWYPVSSVITIEMEKEVARLIESRMVLEAKDVFDVPPVLRSAA
jgi:hypothetical protein